MALAVGFCALAAFPAGAAAALTSVQIDSITNVSYDSAHVNASFEAASTTPWSIEYSTDEQNWVTGGSGLGTGGTNHVQADLTGLKGGTTYFVRLNAQELFSPEVVYSEPSSEFTTLVADPPKVEAVNAPTEIGYSTASVSGEVNRPANSNDLSCSFEYVTDAQFTASGYAEAGQAGCGPVSTVGVSTVNAQLTGLTSGTTYHLRLTVSNASASDTKEAANTFDTKTATAPTVTVNPATEVKYTSAHLSGSLDPEGGNEEGGSPAPITWEFQYSPDPATYGWSAAASGTIEAPQAGESNPIPVSADLSFLANGTEYKYRLVAYYPGNTAYSPEGNFTTQTVSSPVVVVDDATAVTGTSAHFSGEVTAGNDDPAFNANCAFDYVTDQQYQVDGFSSAQSIACVPVDPNTGTVNGPNPVAVHADPTLEPHTLYHLRLRAENQGGQSTDVAANFETEQVAPGVQTLFASKSTASSAVLAGKVNPHNSTATYQFQWGTDTNYGNFAPAAMTPLGFNDNTLHLVTAPLTGLQEGTTYHFRLVAVNSETGQTSYGVDHSFTTTAGQEGSCPNEQLRAETNSLALPECRAYELVMPAAKDYPFGQLNIELAVAAREGGAVAYPTYGPMPGSKSGTQENLNVARRSASEWVNHPIDPPQFIDPALLSLPNTYGFTEDLEYFGFKANPPLADAPEGETSLFVGNTKTDAYTYLGPPSSGDNTYSTGTAIYLISEDGSHVVYRGGEKLYDFVDGSAHEVGVYPGGGVAGLSFAGAGGGGALTYRMFHAMSADGRRIVWNDGGQLYDRIDGTETIMLSESHRAVPDPAHAEPSFWGASKDGDKVFFTDRVALTEDATPGGSTDLYEYDLESETLTDLTAAAGGKADVKGVVGNSDDGQDVYFVAGGALDDGAEAGANNLYLAHGGTITFIAALADADRAAWGLEQSTLGASEGITARVSADGHLAIQSVARLTGYDNFDPVSEQATSQIYLYSPDSRSLICASCRPGGAAPAGNSRIRPPAYGQNISRYLSADGSRLFFDSTDAILPADTNGKMDVYEWTNGAVHLISDGSRPYNSVFQDASANGEDVFFSTGARLVGQDFDSHLDLYDARVGGGFPRPVPPPAPCEGEGCRGAGSSAPGGPSAITGTFSGPGNPQPQKGNGKARAKALKACRRKHKHDKQKRKRCESHVKKRFAKKSGRGK
jgi:phosphodiesterase/alkaline phosphatase D-like protein